VSKWLPFNRGNRKVGWVGMTVLLVSVKNCLMKKVVWDGALSWSNSQVICRQSSGRSLRTVSLSHRKTSQQYAELAVWPARTNSMWITPLKSKKLWACSWLCSSPVSPFSVSTSLYFPCTPHAFFPERLSYHCQGLRRTLSEVCTKLGAVPLLDPSRNRIRPDTRLQIEGRKKSAPPPSWVILCILTTKIF
jgi:hypothetical protein